MSTKIKDAALVGSVSEEYKIPVSDGSNQPKTASVGQIGEFVNQKYGVEQKLTELGSKVGSSSIFNSDSRFEWTNDWIDDDGQRFGLIDSSALASDYGSLFWPGTDKVHQNNLLSYMWAVLMWNTLLDLGYVEGNRINTGDYYKQ